MWPNLERSHPATGSDRPNRRFALLRSARASFPSGLAGLAGHSAGRSGTGVKMSANTTSTSQPRRLWPGLRGDAAAAATGG